MVTDLQAAKAAQINQDVQAALKVSVAGNNKNKVNDVNFAKATVSQR